MGFHEVKCYRTSIPPNSDEGSTNIRQHWRVVGLGLLFHNARDGSVLSNAAAQVPWCSPSHMSDLVSASVYIFTAPVPWWRSPELPWRRGAVAAHPLLIILLGLSRHNLSVCFIFFHCDNSHCTLLVCIPNAFLLKIRCFNFNECQTSLGSFLVLLYGFK